MIASVPRTQPMTTMLFDQNPTDTAKEQELLAFNFQIDSKSYDDDFTFQEFETEEKTASSLLALASDDSVAQDIDDFADLLSCLDSQGPKEVIHNVVEAQDIAMEDDDDEAIAEDIDDFAALMDSCEESADSDVTDLSFLSELLPKDLDSKTLKNLVSSCGIEEETETTDNDESDGEEDVDMEESEGDEKAKTNSSCPVASAQFWQSQAPMDPRCRINTEARFKSMDPRIPVIPMVKVDACFARPGQQFPVASPIKSMTAMPAALSVPVLEKRVVSRVNKPVKVAAACEPEKKVVYVHNPTTCWVCKSDKSESRKEILHKYIEKRYQRNWKRGARYGARSRVATGRVRSGGRFVTKVRWESV